MDLFTIGVNENDNRVIQMLVGEFCDSFSKSEN